MNRYKYFLANIRTSITNFFTKGHQRSIETKRNIAASVFIKGVNIAISLLLVPLTINYVNPTQYGIWLTLSSIIIWFSFFDIGIGNGLRNRFAELKAIGNFEMARIYVSTTYAVLTIIFSFVWILFLIVNFFLDWSKILNAPIEMATELSSLAIIVFSFFSMQIIFKTISIILLADQKPAKSASLDMLGQIIALAIIFILTKTTVGSLLYLGFVFGFIPVLVLFIYSLFSYNNQYRRFAPSLKYIRFSQINDIMGLGFKFFVIQLAGILLFTTTNILITQFYGPNEVTTYNIAYKYFSLTTMMFGVVLTPFWSAITEAYIRNDLFWIKAVMKKLNFLSFIFILITISMIFFANKVFLIWIGPIIKIPISVSIVMSIYFINSLLYSAANIFINGTGKIQLQFYASIFAIIATIPLAFLFCKHFNFGPAGVIGATLVTTFPCMILFRIQYRKIINGNATGIWNR